MDALLSTCFLCSTTAAGLIDISLSGYQILPHDGIQQRFQSQQTVATFDCWEVVGAACATGYSGEEHNKACVDCAPATNGEPGYYADSAQNMCVQCAQDSGWVLAVGVVVGSLIAAPITIKFAGMAKHAGALTAPLMSLVNFLQSIDLFRQLQLHWPASIKQFVLYVASFFNLNINLVGIHPECSFHLSFYEKWMLKMLSPVGVIAALGVVVLIRRFVAQRAKNIVHLGHCVRQTGSNYAMSIRGTQQGEALHLVEPQTGRLPEAAQTLPPAQAINTGLPEDSDAESDAESVEVPRTAPPPRRAQPVEVAEWVRQADSNTGHGTFSTENFLADDDLSSGTGSFRLQTEEQQAQGGGSDMRRSCLKLFGFIIGGLAGAILGFMLFKGVGKPAAGSSFAMACFGYYRAGKKSKPHEGHEITTGEDESTAKPVTPPPNFLFGDQQYAGLDTRTNRRSMVLHVHGASDRANAAAIASIGFFVNFDIGNAVRYEVTLSKTKVCVAKFAKSADWQSETDRIVAKVDGDIFTQQATWIWITVDSNQGRIEIACSSTPPLVGADMPDDIQPLITCEDGDSPLTVQYVAVRSWRESRDEDDRVLRMPHKLNLSIDIPGEPKSSVFRLDHWGQFNHETFVTRSIYVFLVFIMVSYVFLVSTAIQPWICFEDADGRQYLTADPTVNCEPCHFEDDIPWWLGG